MKFSTALAFTRYNSGKNMLDSGGAYGRHWQQPAPSGEDIIRVSEDGGTIETTRWLADWFDLHDLHHAYHEGVEADGHGGFESGASFLEDAGYKCLARDNTYNNENDLSQDFVWEVWVPEHVECADWVWANTWRDSVVVVIYVHTGCDIRGGYSPPMFLTCDDGNCETVFPLTWVCGYGISDTRGAFYDDSPSHEACGEHGLTPDEWCAGYSSNPWRHMVEQLEGAGFTQTRTLAQGWAFRNPETKQTIFVGPDYTP